MKTRLKFWTSFYGQSRRVGSKLGAVYPFGRFKGSGSNAKELCGMKLEKRVRFECPPASPQGSSNPSFSP